MKPIVLVALAPLALGACNFGLPGGNTATANNSAAAAAVPDSVVVNGVTYVRAGATPAPSATIPASSSLSGEPSATPTPPPISDTGGAVPPNTDTSS